MRGWLIAQCTFNPFTYFDDLETVGDGEVGVSLKVRPWGAPDAERSFRAVLVDDSASRGKDVEQVMTSAGLLGRLLGLELAALVHPN